jgi:hypothetical protein
MTSVKEKAMKEIETATAKAGMSRKSAHLSLLGAKRRRGIGKAEKHEKGKKSRKWRSLLQSEISININEYVFIKSAKMAIEGVAPAKKSENEKAAINVESGERKYLSK